MEHIIIRYLFCSVISGDLVTCSKTTQDVKVNLNNTRLTGLKLLQKGVDNC